MALAYNDPDILALIQNGSAGNGPPANTKPQTDFADAQPAADDDISTFAKTGKFPDSVQQQIDQYQPPSSTSKPTVGSVLKQLPAGFARGANNMLAGTLKTGALGASILGLDRASRNLQEAGEIYQDTADWLPKPKNMAEKVASGLGAGGTYAAGGFLATVSGVGPTAAAAMLFGLPAFGETYDAATKAGRSHGEAAVAAGTSAIFNTTVFGLTKRIPGIGPWLEKDGGGQLQGAIRHALHTGASMELMNAGNSVINAAVQKGVSPEAAKQAWDDTMQESLPTLATALGFSLVGMKGAIERGRLEPAEKPTEKAPPNVDPKRMAQLDPQARAELKQSVPALQTTAEAREAITKAPMETASVDAVLAQAADGRGVQEAVEAPQMTADGMIHPVIERNGRRWVGEPGESHDDIIDRANEDLDREGAEKGLSVAERDHIPETRKESEPFRKFTHDGKDYDRAGGAGLLETLYGQKTKKAEELHSGEIPTEPPPHPKDLQKQQAEQEKVNADEKQGAAGDREAEKAQKTGKNIATGEERGESGWIFDKGTGKLLSSSEKGLSVKDEWQSNVNLDHTKHMDRSIDIVHTHPDETSLSDNDWASLGWGHVRSIEAVTPSGKAYRVEKPDGYDWKRATPRMIKDKWNEIEDEIFNSGRSKDMSVEQIVSEINSKMSEHFGMKYRNLASSTRLVRVGDRYEYRPEASAPAAGDREAEKAQKMPRRKGVVEEEPKEKTKNFFRLPNVSTGMTPVLEKIMDAGGIMPRSKMKNAKGEYDGLPTLTELGGFSRVVLGGSISPDVMADTLHREGLIREPTIDAMNDAIRKETKAYRDTRDQNKKQAEDDRQARKFFKDTGAKKSGTKEVNAVDLKIGDVVTVKGEKMTVIDIDPDTMDVLLKDGKTYGLQVVPDGHTLYVEKIKSGKSDTSFNQPESLALEKQTPEEVGKERANKQAKIEYDAQVAEAARLAVAPIVGTQGSIGQPDMFGADKNNLDLTRRDTISAPKPKTTAKAENDSKTLFAETLEPVKPPKGTPVRKGESLKGPTKATPLLLDEPAYTPEEDNEPAEHSRVGGYVQDKPYMPHANEPLEADGVSWRDVMNQKSPLKQDQAWSKDKDAYEAIDKAMTDIEKKDPNGWKTALKRLACNGVA